MEYTGYVQAWGVSRENINTESRFTDLQTQISTEASLRATNDSNITNQITSTSNVFVSRITTTSNVLDSKINTTSNTLATRINAINPVNYSYSNTTFSLVNAGSFFVQNAVNTWCSNISTTSNITFSSNTNLTIQTLSGTVSVTSNLTCSNVSATTVTTSNVTTTSLFSSNFNASNAYLNYQPKISWTSSNISLFFNSGAIPLNTTTYDLKNISFNSSSNGTISYTYIDSNALNQVGFFNLLI